MPAEETIYLHNPTVSVLASGAPVAPLAELRGKTVGFIGNGFPNADAVLLRVRELLQERFQIGAAVWYGSLPPGILPSAQEKEVHEAVAARCDLVVTGVGS